MLVSSLNKLQTLVHRQCSQISFITLATECQTRASSYMNSLDDWLKTFAIDPPMAYLQNLGLPKSVNIFGRTEIESRISFVDQRRRPKLFSEFYTEPQVFGFNVSVEVHRNEAGADRVETPEFFHRKILARKFSDEKFAEVLVKLLDQVTNFIKF